MKRICFGLTLAFVLVLALAFPGGAQRGVNVEPLEAIRRISVSNEGVEANASSYFPRISGNGEWVVFESYATNLIPEADTQWRTHVYAYQVGTGLLSLVSRDADGEPLADINASMASISYDGRFVCFIAWPTNSDRDPYIYRVDRDADEDGIYDEPEALAVQIIHLGPGGSGMLLMAEISRNGEYIVFSSDRDDLVAGDSNEVRDIFVYTAATGTIVRVSTASDGTESDGGSGHGSITAEGRFVVFSSRGSNLAAGDSNEGGFDVFLHDRDADGNSVFDEAGGISTIRISSTPEGLSGNADSGMGFKPTISSDGWYMVFGSNASDLVEGDENDQPDTFLYSLASHTLELVSISTSGEKGNDYSGSGTISDDGRYVIFESWATNLVENDQNGKNDIFVRDRLEGKTVRVSVSAAGVEGDKHAGMGAIAADGSFVTFDSNASNLVTMDGNNVSDIFIAPFAVKVTPPAPPAAPSDLAAVAVSGSEINLTWVDQSDNEEAFEIERALEGGEWEQIGQVEADVESFADSELSCGTTYQYRLRAVNADGYSEYSSSAGASTHLCPLAMPSNLSAAPVGKTQIDLAWTDNSGGEAGFKIERAMEGGPWVEIASLAAGITQYSDKGLLPGTSYAYRLRAFEGERMSEYCSVVTAATDPLDMVFVPLVMR